MHWRILTAVPQSEWRRPVGRPYTSWMATLKNDLAQHNLTLEDAIELALNKPLWWLLAASGATHWWCMLNNDDDVEHCSLCCRQAQPRSVATFAHQTALAGCTGVSSSSCVFMVNAQNTWQRWRRVHYIHVILVNKLVILHECPLP